MHGHDLGKSNANGSFRLPPGAMLALTGATIFPSPTHDVVRDGIVLIDGTRIAAVCERAGSALPPNAQVVDCSGCTITAGFWNAHVHFFERKWSDAGAIPADELDSQHSDTFARFGFTSVFDIGSAWENTRTLRDRIASGEVQGPQIYSTGEALLPPNALPEESVLRVMGVMNFPAPEISSAKDAAMQAQALNEKGVDAIKVFASSPRSVVLTQAVIETVVAEAQRAGKLVFVHPNTADDVMRALRAGVDVIAHTTPTSGPWNEALLMKAADQGAALTPTLMLWKSFLRHDRLSTQSAVVEVALGQLRAWADAGAAVLFGTDLGAVDSDPKDEYLMMARSGMGFRDILASLTTTPTGRFSDSRQSGKVAPGFCADLVVLNADPSRNIAAFADVRCTIRGGKIIFRQHS